MPAAAVIWGCLAAVLSSAVQSFGITLQRKSHVIAYRDPLEDNRDSRRESVSAGEHEYSRHSYKRNMWLVGFFLFIVANVLGSVVQLTTLPLIILSPLQSIGLIFNSIFSCMLLPGEHFTVKLAVGTLVIAIGAFIIAYTGGANTQPPPEMGTDERLKLMLEKFSRPGFLTWWIFTFVFMAILLKVIWSLSHRISSLQLQPWRKMRRGSRTGRDRVSRVIFTRGVLYGVISGTLTAHTFLFAKSMVDVLVETILNQTTPKSLSTYVLAVFLLLFTLSIVGLQLVAFNKGLSNILTAILYPLCFLVYNMINLFNDLFFNRLLSTGAMTAGKLVLVIFGLVNVMFGVAVISWDSAFSDSRNEDALVHMASKFPYEYARDAGQADAFSYEERELMGQFSSVRLPEEA